MRMDAAEYARRNGLTKVGGRPSFGRYLAMTWQRRNFIYSFAKYRIQAANQRARLGMWWVIVTPLLYAVVYGVVFGLLQGDMRPDNFVQFLIVGIFIFQFFSSCFAQGAKSITSNMSLVKSLHFPRIALPLASVTQQFLNFLPMLVVMFAVQIAFGATPQWRWLIIIALVVMVTVFNTGVTLISARLTVHVRDLSQLIPLLNRIMFYTSGIFFQISTILEDYPLAIRIYDFHPLHVYLTIGRSAFLDEVSASGEYWITGTAWALALFVIGIVYFWRAEERYGRDD